MKLTKSEALTLASEALRAAGVAVAMQLEHPGPRDSQGRPSNAHLDSALGKLARAQELLEFAKVQS